MAKRACHSPIPRHNNVRCPTCVKAEIDTAKPRCAGSAVGASRDTHPWHLADLHLELRIGVNSDRVGNEIWGQQLGQIYLLFAEYMNTPTSGTKFEIITPGRLRSCVLLERHDPANKYSPS